MICPECRTPNPDGVRACTNCSTPLPAGDVRIRMSDQTAMPTAATPRSLKEWAQSKVQSSATAAILPGGLEIGHRYKIAHLLGLGGMGAVYLARDLELERDVALKLIRSDVAEDPASLERFKREIQLSSQITHRNVLRVYDLAESDGIKFLTMQFVEGKDLAAILKKSGKIPVARLIPLFRQVADGLEAAHEAGVVHRDLKPQNILVDANDRVYVTDFGLAKGAAHSAMTQTGAVLGTPHYMSPEQVKGRPADSRSDIFSLGVILYEMATGVLPYPGDTPYEVMVLRTQRPPRPPREVNPELPSFLGRIIERCLAMDPAARYQSVAEILADLDTSSFRPTMRFRVQRYRPVVPAAAVAGIVLLLTAAGWWALHQRRSSAAPPGTPRTISILIADFANRASDPLFDETLEPAFGLSIEGASFVTTYNRGQARKLAQQLQPGATGLSETLARLVAVREGIQVVTSGSIEKTADGYVVSVHAVDAVTGKTVADAKEEASGKDGVLTAVAKAAAAIRNALGDATPASVQLAAAETFSAGSLEAAHEYAVAQGLQGTGQWDEAIRHYQKATELDPNLGRAYAGIAAISANQGRRDDSAKAFQLAMARIDRMTDREKFRTRGNYYLAMREPQKAHEQFSELVRQYPADSAGLANLAIADFYRRDMKTALAEGRRAVAIYPKSVPQRNNVALYAMYAGDFEAAIAESRTVLQMNPSFAKAYVALALSQAALGQRAEAAKTYEKLEKTGGWGASLASIGLADLALAEGRSSDALSILEKGIEKDLAEKLPEAAARKLVALAEADLALGKTAPASAAADRAAALARGENILLPAARVYIETGKEERVRALAADLAARFEPDARAYAKLIEGEAKVKRGRPGEAIADFEEARKISDTWLGRLDLGLGYLAANAFPEADGELEACVKRRGEALAVFLDDVPSLRYLPPVYYSLGRAQEGLKSPAAADSYKAFLSFKGNGGRDPLVADARRRLGLR